MDLAFNLSGQLDPVAAYAAVVATVVLLWDIVKWRQSGMRLKARVNVNMMTVGMGPMDRNKYIVVNVDNVGGKPTTIHGLYFHGYRNWIDKLRHKPRSSAFINSGLQNNYPIPYNINVGMNFMGSALQDSEVEKWSRDNLLFLEIAFGPQKSLKVRVPPIHKKMK